ncbi:transporter substrate-binding domain-containing protein [Lacticaseibacillus baoqingensis]|uniref:Transporter substrate-binding domain-containing protein n=1 Tax=Lacticaseibacillus baoqingensis TaxID=2486013 RepID=A0ABW4E6P3_9LACO|nr:transporter substrate-binding domain-containing protein [Lacticaseibacillus baoqingensis]
MKKTGLLSLVVTAALALTVLAGCGQQSASSQKKLVVGTTEQTYPNSYKKNGKLAGFDIDVTNAIAKKMGYQVTWKVIGDVPGLFGALDSNKVDTIANAVTVLPARKKTYAFSDNYAYDPGQIAVPTSSSAKSVKDLEGKTVSATLGSSNIDLLKKYDPKVNVKPYDDRNGVFTDANNGKVAGVLNQRQLLRTTIKKQNLKLRILSDKIGINETAFPFKKGDAKADKLRTKYNQALKALAKDGTLKKLSVKYFGEDITKQ